ncbi:MAG: chemotaxis protein CheW [Thermodesulfobacteriota bacterium]|nr:chemotaxis protein CheW [Thermodesulfobacteriota bacterium]
MKELTSQSEDRCWKRIGVWGREKPVCPRLKEVIHCRNCEVFTQAGRNLLERDLPENYRNEWGRVLLKKKEEELAGAVSVVVFRVRGEWLALPAQLFAEVIHVSPVHSIPHCNSMSLLGVINVHGDIQLCVSLERYLGLQAEDVSKGEDHRSYRHMMVVDKDGEQWVFPVDEVLGIHHVHPSSFQNVPVTVSKSRSAFTKGIFKWKDKYVAFLDDELLIYSLTRSVQ